MSMIPNAQQLGPPPRRVRLTHKGWIMRLAPWVISLVFLVLFLIFLLIGRRRDDAFLSGKPWLVMIAALIAVELVLLVALAEFAIRRETRWARDWTASDVLWEGGQPYGLVDQHGRPLASSPPIESLSPADAQLPKCTVLYQPNSPLRLRRPEQFRFVEIIPAEVSKA
jgi:hypothetical protein